MKKLTNILTIFTVLTLSGTYINTASSSSKQQKPLTKEECIAEHVALLNFQERVWNAQDGSEQVALAMSLLEGTQRIGTSIHKPLYDHIAITMMTTTMGKAIGYNLRYKEHHAFVVLQKKFWTAYANNDVTLYTWWLKELQKIAESSYRAQKYNSGKELKKRTSLSDKNFPRIAPELKLAVVADIQRAMHMYTTKHDSAKK
jgi:hypothetical protein